MENNNLSTFRILYLVKGILTLAFSLFFVLYAMFGYFFTDLMEQEVNNSDLPFNPGAIFTIIGIIGFIISLTFGILTLIASKYIKERRSYTFIFVVAILNCLTGILGILLGVFSLIELNKPEIKSLFDKRIV